MHADDVELVLEVLVGELVEPVELVLVVVDVVAVDVVDVVDVELEVVVNSVEEIVTAAVDTPDAA